jgi:hypothetical protein
VRITQSVIDDDASAPLRRIAAGGYDPEWIGA